MAPDDGADNQADLPDPPSQTEPQRTIRIAGAAISGSSAIAFLVAAFIFDPLFLVGTPVMVVMLLYMARAGQLKRKTTSVEQTPEGGFSVTTEAEFATDAEEQLRQTEAEQRRSSGRRRSRP
jgi:hypothetical protein